MYVLVHHEISDPASFWATVEKTPVPAPFKLHQTLTAKDGSRATCLWEGESVDAVRNLVDPLLGNTSKNQYAEAENKDGLAMPSQLK